MENRYLLKEDNQESYDQFRLSGKSIDRIQNEAKKLCSLLSLALGFRVIQLIADFAKTKNDTFYLTNVKGFLLEETNYELKVKEHLHLIENQAVVLEELRKIANDSSKHILYISTLQIVWI